MSQKRCKQCNVKMLGYNPPDLCNKCKPMQNKEEEWEEQIKDQIRSIIIDAVFLTDGMILNTDVNKFTEILFKSFSQEIEKSYQKGKEERERETVDERVWRCVRNETLEEVGKVVKERIAPTNKDKVIFDGYYYIDSEWLLQTLNKMKEHERHN